MPDKPEAGVGIGVGVGVGVGTGIGVGTGVGAGVGFGAGAEPSLRTSHCYYNTISRVATEKVTVALAFIRH
jgi:hypothetical protein